MSDKKTIVTLRMPARAAEKLERLVAEGKLEKDDQGRIIWDEERIEALMKERETKDDRDA